MVILVVQRGLVVITALKDIDWLQLEQLLADIDSAFTHTLLQPQVYVFNLKGDDKFSEDPARFNRNLSF